MNDKLQEFLGKIDTKLPTIFAKTKNSDKVDVVATFSQDSEGVMATTGWCVIDTFPEESFSMEPDTLKSLLELGKELSVKDGNLIAVDRETNSIVFWRLKYENIETINITYDEKPIVVPANIINKLKAVSELKVAPSNFRFVAKNNILTINASIGDSGDKFNVRIPGQLPDLDVRFDGTVANIFKLLSGDISMIIPADNTKPTQVTTTGDGWLVRHYLVPIDMDENTSQMPTYTNDEQGE